MSLTTAQNATLKAAMLADANVIAIVGQDQKVADYYNAPSSPTVAIWIPNLPRGVILAATNWVAFATKTALLQTTYNTMMLDGFIDATNANFRNGFGAVFSGADLTALSNAAQRTGTRLEVLFSAGGPPAVSTLFGHLLSDVEVNAARNS
jgi:hypothetical protein